MAGHKKKKGPARKAPKRRSSEARELQQGQYRSRVIRKRRGEDNYVGVGWDEDPYDNRHDLYRD